jgi:cytochrome c peroxidase
MRFSRIVLSLSACLLIAGVGRAWTPAEKATVLSLSPVPKTPSDATNRLSGNVLAIALGKKLFFAGTLSGTGVMSCATCHEPGAGFASSGPLLPRDDGIMQARHAPSLLGVGHNRWFFWDGRRDTLWAQALEAIETDMSGSAARASFIVDRDPELRAGFAKLSTDQSPEARFILVGKALAAYVETLEIAPAPFDGYVAALRTGRVPPRYAQIEAGLRLFLGKGNCVACHNGPLLTDGEFHSARLPSDPAEAEDAGRFVGLYLLKDARYSAGSKASDAPAGERAQLSALQVQTRDSWGLFKTPSLRGVGTRTSFMHDGSFPSLERVVDHYSVTPGATSLVVHDVTAPQAIAFTEEEKAQLLAFLRSL